MIETSEPSSTSLHNTEPIVKRSLKQINKKIVKSLESNPKYHLNAYSIQEIFIIGHYASIIVPNAIHEFSNPPRKCKK